MVHELLTLSMMPVGLRQSEKIISGADGILGLILWIVQTALLFAGSAAGWLWLRLLGFRGATCTLLFTCSAAGILLCTTTRQSGAREESCYAKSREELFQGVPCPCHPPFNTCHPLPVWHPMEYGKASQEDKITAVFSALLKVVLCLIAGKVPVF